MNIANEIKAIQDGQCWIWPESDYGKAEIWMINDVFFLFEIPTFGGQLVYVKNYNGIGHIGELIAAVRSWT